VRSKGLAAFAVLSVGAAAFASQAVAQGRLGQNANVPLITQDGQQVHFYDDVLKGKTVAVNFVYIHCMFAYPLETPSMVQVQKVLGDRIGKDTFFYSISIGPGWTSLTGNRADTDLIAYRPGLTDDPDITELPLGATRPPISVVRSRSLPNKFGIVTL
jgi:protein SCO1